MYFLLVFDEASFFCFVSSVLDGFATFETLSLFDLFGGVKVLRINVISLNSELIQLVCG
jgi:hypothetical protein